jgi:hypothetical protein
MWASLGFGAVALAIGILDLNSTTVLLSVTFGILAVTNGVHAFRFRRQGITQDVLLPSVGIAMAVVGTLLMVSTFVPHSVVPSYAGSQISQPVQALPQRVTYATEADEHAALLLSARGIASSLTGLDLAGQAMPTDYEYSNAGEVLGEPTGVALGTIPVGGHLETMRDSAGKLQTLTLVGPTFGDRVTLDVGTMGPHATT